MKVCKVVAGAVFVLSLAGLVSAQTNFVTVTITNIVFVTNVVSAAKLPAPPAGSAPEKKTTNAWNQTVSAGLTLVRGNTDVTLTSADYSAVKKTPKNEFIAAAGIAYGVQNSQESVDNYKGSFQWNHLFTQRWYGFLRCDGLRDYIADVDYRVTLGGGVGYYALKETNTTLAFEFGANGEAESLGGMDTAFATIRLADRFEHRINNHARFWQTAEIFPEVDQWDNYVVNFELGAEASFNKSWSLKTCLDESYNNRPAFQHLKNDVKLVAGVSYKF
jgi:putative salt-induced outer membrane protein YdiY